MPMHPGVATYDLLPMFELLFGENKSEVFGQLLQEGFINETTRRRWQSELEKPGYGAGIGDLVAILKMRLDPQAAADGKLSSKSSRSILANLLPLMEATKSFGYDYSLQQLRNKTILDFGGGVYYPLSTAVVLFANGYGRAISYEPFELRIDYAVSSLFELVRAIFEQPAVFCFSGVSGRELKENLARLNFERLPEKLTALNSRAIDSLDLGGVVLTNKTEAIADASVHVVFSNSVLEHVGNLPAELAWQKRVLVDKGLCFHTVDFADHRYYFDKSLNIMELYYDGICDEINGLRPAEMEGVFGAAGFAWRKFHKLAVPDTHKDGQRVKAPQFARYAGGDMFEWVNSYILQKI